MAGSDAPDAQMAEISCIRELGFSGCQCAYFGVVLDTWFELCRCGHGPPSVSPPFDQKSGAQKDSWACGMRHPPVLLGAGRIPSDFCGCFMDIVLSMFLLSAFMQTESSKAEPLPHVKFRNSHESGTVQMSASSA